jgi:hypothetical protein
MLSQLPPTLHASTHSDATNQHTDWTHLPKIVLADDKILCGFVFVDVIVVGVEQVAIIVSYRRRTSVGWTIALRQRPLQLCRRSPGTCPGLR